MKSWIGAAALTTGMALAGTNAAFAEDSWSGFYFGAAAGGTFMSSTHNIGGAPHAVINGSTFSGGPVVGYNFQTGNWVFGPEVSALFGTAAAGETTTSTFAGGFRFDKYVRLTNLYLINARIGMAHGAWLGYITGGAAIGAVTAGQNAFNTGGGVATPNAGFTASGSSTHVGFNIGAGVERKLTKHLVAGVDYKYFNLGNNPITLNGFALGPGTARTNVSGHVITGRLTFLLN